MRALILFFLFFLMFSIGFDQQKVANYFTGKYGTKEYEHFSFWLKDGKAFSVEYSYGTKPKKMVLEIVGTKKLNGEKVLKVQFPNKYILLIITHNKQLHVRDANTAYNKTFQWEYEGPVNGAGTFCDVCAEDETEAISIVEKFNN